MKPVYEEGLQQYSKEIACKQTRYLDQFDILDIGPVCFHHPAGSSYWIQREICNRPHGFLWKRYSSPGRSVIFMDIIPVQELR